MKGDNNTDMKILIKNMVALGTKKFVLNEVKKMGLKLLSFESGELIFQNDLTANESETLKTRLEKYGLELIYSEPPESKVEVMEMAETVHSN